MAHHQFESGSARHCEVGVTVGFSLHDFSAVFQIRNEEGMPYILIGGQAVNYWAERYEPIDPDLLSLRPFTSQDIDFKGNRADVQRIANQLNLFPTYPRKVEMTSLAGSISFQIGDLKSNIEIVRSIPGIPTPATPAIEAEWEGKSIRVLDPISLLACKLELARTVSQENRQDLNHLRILVPCVRGFLGELLQQVEAGNLPPRDWLKVANQVLKLTTNLGARRITSQHHIHWLEILPQAAIAKSQNAKIRRFRENLLQRSKGSSF
jgi:hypothetical protein